VNYPSIFLLFFAIAVVAFLYSSVGHAGASGYIAVMTLFGLSAATIRPVALILNILVATIGSFQFWRAGHFSWRIFWPFALFAIPGAFLGGYVHPPIFILRLLIGLVLLFSAARLFLQTGDPDRVTVPPLAASIPLGAGIGLLSGLTGTGGGIFLTPLLLLSHWARTKQAAAVSALFIFVNSIAGLSGYFISNHNVPLLAFPLALAAVVGGVIGSYLGSRRLPAKALLRLLAIVLVIAGLKLICTR
jgi:uncharacterized membrane protein YfcA